MTLDFKSKTTIITGGGSGIGRASAKQFARGGANVVVADYDPDAADETVSQIKSAGGTAVAVEVDVRKPDEVRSLVASAVDEYGSVDIAHNNAGIEGTDERMSEQTETNWDRVIDTNLKGVWLCLKHELRAMADDGGGAIVNTSSISGLSGAGNTPYVASKHGVIGLTRVAATEYAQHDVRVNAVCPGATDTSLVRDEDDKIPDETEQYLYAVPLGRLGTPQEIADAVTWLCSDRASFVTGNAYPVDGGFTAF